MKRYRNILFASFVTALAAACAPSLDTPNSPNIPFSATLMGKWVLTDTQSAGTGPPGVWAVASPAGRWMEIKASGVVDGGTVFSQASGYQLIDSVTLKVIDPSEAAGFRLFNYQVDTVKKALFFYKRPANGWYCIEGCGTLRFGRG